MGSGLVVTNAAMCLSVVEELLWVLRTCCDGNIGDPAVERV